MVSLSSIDDFLSRKHIAFIGLSRDPKHFSRMLYKEFRKRSIEVSPVNPNTDSIDGAACFKSVSELPQGIDAALLLLPKGEVTETLRSCAGRGIKDVWVYGVMGEKEVPADAIAAASELGMNLIPGFCPFMFLKDAPFPHRLHGWIWRLLGKIPAK